MIDLEQSHETLLAIVSSFYKAIDDEIEAIGASEHFLFTYQSHYSVVTVSAWVYDTDHEKSAEFELQNGKWTIKRIGDYQSYVAEMLSILVKACGGGI